MQIADTPMSRTTVTVPTDMLAEAKAMQLNVSRFVQRSLASELARLKAARWEEDNKAGIEAYNAFVAKHGVLTAQLRKF